MTTTCLLVVLLLPVLLNMPPLADGHFESAPEVVLLLLMWCTAQGGWFEDVYLAMLPWWVLVVVLLCG